MDSVIRKPRMGLLLLGAERFQKLGEGTKRGSYSERKLAEAAWMKADAEKIADVTFTGIVYTASDVQRAIDAFVQDKVDYVLANLPPVIKNLRDLSPFGPNADPTTYQ